MTRLFIEAVSLLVGFSPLLGLSSSQPHSLIYLSLSFITHHHQLEPETLEHIVDEFDEFMIIATDGVWDVIDNNQAVQMVQNFVSKSSHWSTLDASNTITKFARSRWEKLSPMVDDITAIVVCLKRS